LEHPLENAKLQLGDRIEYPMH